MTERKSKFITSISWFFILTGFLSFIIFLLPSISTSIQSFTIYNNPELVENTLKDTNTYIENYFLPGVYGMNILFLFITLISFIFFIVGIFLLKRRTWARKFFCLLFLIKIIITFIFTIFYLYLMFVNIKMGILVFSFSFMNLIFILIYKKLSSESIKNEFNIRIKA